ncbi:murein transglycosylase [Photobacterium lutimaris]|uniref:Murein transglycosylase n=1 Tax=Photobacterium lutimaris TaxID=388278 RepID=A0A2T3ITZ8_9GAMM|nr:murein transglycosylase [Photobacterium lutimaris]PSU31846.1 murein transglycosylase [Photobacterium lutimaris]TDR73368.1 soluble lytic murein transglycosylase [Photobacterium lutimaris]
MGNEWKGAVFSNKNIKVFSGLVLFVGLLMSPLMRASTLEQQREWYEQAQVSLEEKDEAAYKALRRKLDDYPLTPYLDYREFIQTLYAKSPSEVEAFIEQYTALPFSTTVKDRYLTHLATTERWQNFVEVQPLPPRSQVLRCHYYYAQSKLGNKDVAWQGAKTLWLTGKSTHDACDPLLNTWQKAGKRTDALILDRMLLVYAEGNRARLNYLNKQLGAKSKQSGKLVLDLYDKPQGVAAFSKRSKVTPLNQNLAVLAYKKLVHSDIKEAVKQYHKTVQGQHFDEAKRQSLADYTASRLMATDDEKLQKWRDNALAKTTNINLLERRIRQAMREDKWDEVEVWVNRLPDKAKQSTRWTFWQARLAEREGNKELATDKYTQILGQRDFYSAAAATVLGKPITYPVKTAGNYQADIEEYALALARIKELIAVDKLLAANREWHYLLRGLDNDKIVTLAAYAATNKWHHLAVQATISGQLWDYIELRFPVAHKWWFDFFSKKRELPVTTMMALARQESALNIEAISPVGARGLMQLMPATAKETAKKLGRNYEGKSSLFDPGVNIRLGSGYLKMMLEQYDNNRIFAFAAYNAGPSRVTRWRNGTDGRLDVYAFIEAIPFNETRGYVQNILMFEIYYGDLTQTPVPLLTENEINTQY